VVRLASGGDRLTFAGDAVFAVGFEHPDCFAGAGGAQRELGKTAANGIAEAHHSKEITGPRCR